MASSRVIVVGTTSDYIEAIEQRFPGRALCLTDHGERARAMEPEPDEAGEALCGLGDTDDALAALRAHLLWWDITPSGVACFDDESMALASSIAKAFGLPYVSAEAVAACRSKLACKQRWREAGLPCPDFEFVETAEAAVAFQRRVGGPIVLKPLTGSGSELTFLCTTPGECREGVAVLASGLASHHDVRMYAPQGEPSERMDPRRVFAAEEFVQGSEYSCDFAVDGGHVQIIRFAAKVAAPTQSFGTTLAYIVPAELPAAIDRAGFERQLLEAARALGIDRALGMLDFFVRGDSAVMIEMAPRPGGDCLPSLLRASSGLDILGAALDFAERRPLAIPVSSAWRRLVGLRLFGSDAGVIARIDARALRRDPRVVECRLKRRPGHRIILPPADYESRLLGHAVFDPQGADGIESACLELAAKLRLELRPIACTTPTAC